MEHICIQTWQTSTIEEQCDDHDFVVVAISPSQFRSLLSSTPRSISFARHILDYALSKFSSSQKLVVLIADQIQKYNVAVFEHKNEECSLKTATSLGQKISSFFFQVLEQISPNDRQRIQIINWTDMLTSSNYDARVEDIRVYTNNHPEQCLPLIDKVCQEYARARSPKKVLKTKEVVMLREYVIAELPALLNGIEYSGDTYRFMLHPVLKTDNSNGNDQREAMVALLDHMRKDYFTHATITMSMCRIFDVEIPRSSIVDNDEELSDSSQSSSVSSASEPIADTSRPTLQETALDTDGNLDYLWLCIFIQLSMLIIRHFWLPILSACVFAYGLYYIYISFLEKVSKHGEWPSTTADNSKGAVGTKYQTLFGDLPAIQSSQNGRFLNDLHTDLGCPQAYRIYMGPEPALMLAHYHAVKDFWSQQNEKCVERDVHLGWPLQMLMGSGVGFRSIADRNRITKFFHQCFGPSQLRRFDLHLESLTTDFLRSYTSEQMQYQNLRYFAHDAAVHLFLGDVGFNHLDELHSLVDELADLMNEVFDGKWTNIPVIGYYLLPNSYSLRKRIRAFNSTTRNLLKKIINTYRQTSSVDEHDTDTNISLLKYYAHDSDPTITFDELTDTIIEGLLAPNDGTAGTFMYTLLLLAMHPDIQEKAREEIRSLSDLTSQSLSTTTYLDQILSECQRICPIFMFNVPEFTSAPMTISGIQVPKNTMIMLDVVSLNHSSDIWSEPLRFRPERFDVSNAPVPLKAYHGFGNGHSRRCLGQHLVKNLHRLFLAHLLNEKQIQLVNKIESINDMKRCRLPFIYIPAEAVRLVQI
ncbi:unnamed protein product [Adineta ricciae]|uniref:Cytochrome P450 n=1 Tax=Adineta ricciae TaxID=249248 RepID=A0A814Z419_ADIRI|nr:unnamed protein product [Adineta ricciae]CAF1308748.1 unnamed protein product [Adineta ricciae]